MIQKSVRHRTSFANLELIWTNATNMTNAFDAHVLYQCSHAELARVLNVLGSARVHGAPSTNLPHYRGASLTRNSALLGPYFRSMPRAHGGPEKGAVSFGQGTPVHGYRTDVVLPYVPGHARKSGWHGAQ